METKAKLLSKSLIILSINERDANKAKLTSLSHHHHHHHLQKERNGNKQTSKQANFL
jgi:hypothetical protein